MFEETLSNIYVWWHINWNAEEADVTATDQSSSEQQHDEQD